MSAPHVIELGRLSIAESLTLAVEVARARLVCLPTDTVYGVGGACRPEVAQAIAAAKGREPDKPLQLLFPSREVLFATLELSPLLRDVAYRLLPGPFTLVIPYPDGLGFPPPGQVTRVGRGLFARGEETVATLGLRVPRWPTGAQLLSTLGFPLLASSANPAGRPAPAQLGEVDPAVRAACDLMLDGGPASGVASAVVDFTGYEADRSWRILRQGAVGPDQIREMLTRKREDLPTP